MNVLGEDCHHCTGRTVIIVLATTMSWSSALPTLNLISLETQSALLPSSETHTAQHHSKHPSPDSPLFPWEIRLLLELGSLPEPRRAESQPCDTHGGDGVIFQNRVQGPCLRDAGRMSPAPEGPWM